MTYRSSLGHTGKLGKIKGETTVKIAKNERPRHSKSRIPTVHVSTATMSPREKVFDNPTPLHFLSAIRQQHREQCGCDDEADPTAKLNFDTTVSEWREACDLVGWRQLAGLLNEYWDLDIPLDEWKHVLEPAEKRTLRDVCELLATEARAQ